MAFHKGLEDRNADGRINTGDDRSTSHRTLTSFGPVTPEITTLDYVTLGKNRPKDYTVTETPTISLKFAGGW